jgi:hypothetical protein
LESWSNVGGLCTYATADYAIGVIKHTTQTDTINQYTKVTLGPSSDIPCNPSIILRYVNSSSGFYHVYVSGYYGDVYIYKASDTSGGGYYATELATSDLGTAPFTLGVTITGTSSTIIRVFTNPTGNTPLSADHWDSGDTPSISVTDSTSPYTTGKYLGLGGMQGSASTLTFDNWWGGDL